eukprot:scaffold17477_cov41-Cyclotella_meneghiniana.AAC.6
MYAYAIIMGSRRASRSVAQTSFSDVMTGARQECSALPQSGSPPPRLQLFYPSHNLEGVHFEYLLTGRISVPYRELNNGRP